MEFFLIFVATVAGISFLKFIWDSYLTDNTEKNWKEYKQIFPAEAVGTKINASKKISDQSNVNTINLTIQLPNLLRFYKTIPSKLNPEIVSNCANRFEIKMPVKVSNEIVGYNHFGVEVSYPKYEMYIYSLSNSGKKISVSPILLGHDLNVDQYDQLLSKLVNKMLSRPDYQKFASGKAFEVVNKSDIEKLLGKACQLYSEEKDEEAKKYFHKVIEYDPDYYEVYFLLIDMYLNENDLYPAGELIGKLDVMKMKGLITLDKEDSQKLKDLKFRKFELQEKRNN